MHQSIQICTRIGISLLVAYMAAVYTFDQTLLVLDQTLPFGETILLLILLPYVVPLMLCTMLSNAAFVFVVTGIATYFFCKWCII
jgi:hypothetical protein